MWSVGLSPPFLKLEINNNFCRSVIGNGVSLEHCHANQNVRRSGQNNKHGLLGAQLLAFFVPDVPGLEAGFGFDPAGFDAEEVDLFLDSNSNLSSCFHSSSLSFSFFFSLQKK